MRDMSTCLVTGRRRVGRLGSGSNSPASFGSASASTASIVSPSRSSTNPGLVLRPQPRFAQLKGGDGGGVT